MSKRSPRPGKAVGFEFRVSTDVLSRDHGAATRVVVDDGGSVQRLELADKTSLRRLRLP
jgi:hypothetical protein